MFSMAYSAFYSNSKSQYRQKNIKIDSIKTERFPVAENECYVISNDIELHGKSFVLPKNVTLKFCGGKIKHGTLIGNNTKIIGTEKLFDKVTIKGTWIVKEISAKMFVSVGDTNELRNLVALSNPQIDNTIYIPKGKYFVKAEKGKNKILIIPSNTKLILDGDIYLAANSLIGYSIIYISNSRNVTIEGKGRIIGDRQYHIGTEGQWGMCVSMTKASNVKINDISTLDAWGDGIYVGSKSDSIIIDGCKIRCCRRQGISVIGGKCIRIRNCEIKNIRGHAPEYSIDIEPNSRDTVVDVLIDNVVAEDCVGGFKSYSSLQKKCYISNLKIINCKVIKCKKIPFNIMGANNVELDSNFIEKCSSEKIYNFLKSKNIVLNKKKVNKENYILKDLYDVIKDKVGE